MDDLDFTQSADSLAVLMSSGIPEITLEPVTGTFTLSIREDDTEEIKDVKRSVEFTINTAQEMIGILKTFARQTGNPKFFEAVNAFLVTINGSIGKLIDVKKMSQVQKTQKAEQITNIQNNIVEQVPETKMTTREAFKVAMGGSVIDAVVVEESK